MTEDERIFVVAGLDHDLDAAQAKLLAIEATLGKMDRIISQQKMVLDSLMETLDSLMKAPVISLIEFRSVATGRNKAETDLQTMRSKRAEASKLHVNLQAEIDRLEQERQRQQHELDNPPQVVLEFKPRE